MIRALSVYTSNEMASLPPYLGAPESFKGTKFAYRSFGLGDDDRITLATQDFWPADSHGGRLGDWRPRHSESSAEMSRLLNA